MYTAPPKNALLSGSNETREARERMQKGNFTIKDAHGGTGPVTTQSQANNQIRQSQMANGQILSQQAVAKPVDSINFGQAIEYTSTAKATFVGMNQNNKSQIDDKNRFKNNFTKPNINFGKSPNKEAMMTVAQANEQIVSRQNLGNSMNQDQNAKSKENAGKMRVANFKMGSILPEHNGYKVSQLDQKDSG